MERALGRPLMDRNVWPLHVMLRSGSTSASASAVYGAFLNADASLLGPTFDYLVVEQLARLVTADLLDKLGSAPYWIQETYIQWLTTAALSEFYTTRQIHDFQASKIDGYKSGSFPDEVALSAWDASNIQTAAGSQKALILALRLDALVGSSNMSKVFSLFANAIPSSDVLKAQLQAVSPANAAAIDDLWAQSVDGLDRAGILAELADNDGDGLYLFEEAKLGSSDSAYDNYLAP
jgi:hypothetical protein